MKYKREKDKHELEIISALEIIKRECGKREECSGGISPICSGVIFFRFNYNNSLYPKLYLYMWNNNSNNKNIHNFNTL